MTQSLTPAEASALVHAPVASGMTLYHLQTAAAIGQVLQDLYSQSGVVSLFVPVSPEGSVPPQDSAPQPTPVLAPSPLAMARLLEVDMHTATVRWHVAGHAGPLPEQLVAVAHMAGGVRVQCVLQGAWQPAMAPDAPGWVLHTTWPQEVLQLQRRRHPRLSVPLGQNYSASFLFGRRRCTLDIDDLSIAGLALRGTRPETAMLFIGRQLPKVALRLSDGTVLHADLHVRSRRSYRSFLLGEQVLVGCSIEAMGDDDQATLSRLLAHGMWGTAP